MEPTPQTVWDKVVKATKSLGTDGVSKVLVLYAVMTDSAVSAAAKAAAVAALAYFVMPFDAIPDILVGVGYTDDITAMGAALAALGSSVTDEHREYATQKMAEWFGNENNTHEEEDR